MPILSQLNNHGYVAGFEAIESESCFDGRFTRMGYDLKSLAFQYVPWVREIAGDFGGLPVSHSYGWSIDHLPSGKRSHRTMERSTFFSGKIHYFYGHLKGEKGKPSFFPHDRGVGTEKLNKLMKMVGATMPKNVFFVKIIYPDV